MRRRRGGLLMVIMAALVLGAGCRGAEREGPTPAPMPASSQEPTPPAWGTSMGEPLDENYSARRTPGPPLSLSASDGTGLRLVSLKARAVVDDPLALTELRLVFENPQNRELEGTFSITLPPGAALSRFAMRLGERWQEGEVVEKQAARRAYEDFLHRKQDPALLEQAAGNQFSARVFPIPARGRKELIVSYSQELRGEEPYAISLRGLPEIGEIDLAAFLPGRAEPAHARRAERHAPVADFGFRLGPRPAGALRSGELVMARVRPLAETQPDPLASLLVLFDTSASRALGFEAQIDALRALLADVARAEGPNASVAVFCFDQNVESVYEGPADGFGEAQAATIRQRGALGASDLGAALVAAGEQARPRGLKRVLVVSDGVTTAGDAVGDKVGAAAQALKDAGVERLDALVVGGIRDESMLARIVRSGLARDGAVIESDAETADISRRLRAATRPVEVRVEGASWQYPRSLAGVQSGDDVLVYAELPADQPLKVSVGGELQRLAEPRQVERALLQRAWARAKIASLVDEQKREGAQESGVKQIIDLSIKHRVVSPYTALLVLETEQDYARFGLTRHTLADILTPQKGSIEVLDRSPGARKAQAGQAPDSRDGAKQDGAPSKDKASDAKPEASPKPARPLARPAKPDSAPALQAPRFDENGPSSSPGATPAPMMVSPRMAAGGMSAGVSGGVVGGVIGGVLRGAKQPQEVELDRSDPYAAVEKKAEVETSASDRDATGLSLAAPSEPRPVVQAPPPARRPIDPETQNESNRPKFRNPYAGKFREVMAMLAGRRFEQALEFARAWCTQWPGDVMALVALGTAYEAAGEMDNAARAYGSLIDLYPARADLRRFAGARLEHVAEAKGMALAVDTFRKAVEQRPDHPSSHRLLAFALAKRGAYSDALDAALVGLRRRYPEGRFEGVKRILREDAGLLGAALVRAEPERQAETEAKLRAAGASLERGPSLRFVLNWETDANDVDFHIYDAEGGHAFFQQPELPTGGSLYADVTTGYGPECFTVRKSPGARSSLYTLQAHYFSRGPMGYGMGKLEIVEHDGKGGLAFEERPFVIMVDDAFVNLGTVSRSTLSGAARTASAK